MKRSILLCVIVLAALGVTAFAQAPAGGQARGGRPNIFAPEPQASGPIGDFVRSMVTAFNNKDMAFFQKSMAPDAVWLDEDGHHLQGMVWINRLLSATPARTLSITNLRVNSWDTGGWAGFNYVIEGTQKVKGTNSMVFKKTGNDWQIVLVHGAVDTLIGQH
jgi:ketosteroid isomerase-like protein